MNHSINIFDLGTSLAKIYASRASLIIAIDESSYDDPVVLFDSNGANITLTIELESGDVLFETANLHLVCDFINTVKGRCDYQMSHEGINPDDHADGWPKPLESFDEKLERLFEDEDDGADWWKGGDA